jgi:hypothetical protein
VMPRRMPSCARLPACGQAGKVRPTRQGRAGPA